MTDKELMRQAVIHSFAMVARPIILEYFPPRSCISSTRIVIECLQAFGILARPIPVQFSLYVPKQKTGLPCVRPGRT